MDSSLKGRVGKYKTTQNGWLMGVYEAVSNSLYSTEDFSSKSGKIEIVITRYPSTLDDKKANNLQAIQDITIIDNGVGFTPNNLSAFSQLDSELSLERGRKGEGRLSWLAYFSRAEVTSTFLWQDEWKQIEFDFSIENNGAQIRDESLLYGDNEQKTSVSLLELDVRFHKNSQQSDREIGEKIVAHFIANFISGTMPNIFIRDEKGLSEYSLDEIFKDDYQGKRDKQEFNISGQSFTLENLLVEVSDKKKKANHLTHWCGQKRTVSTRSLSGLSFLNKEVIHDNAGKKFTYVGVLQSNYLDNALDEKRLTFMLPQDGDLEGLDSDLTEQSLTKEINEHIGDFLEPHLQRAKEMSFEKLLSYVENEAPEYHYLLSNPEFIAKLKSNNYLGMSYHEIGDQLNRVEREIRKGISINNKKLLHAGLEDPEKIHDRVQELMNSLSEVNQIDLSRYVTSRKVILDIFDGLRNIQEDGKFAKEERIHELIFPMRDSSANVLQHGHNLWLLDDRLAFHSLLYSDMPLRKAVEEGDGKEPDLMVFQRVHISREGLKDEPLHSATIIEFKRPERKGLKGKDDPIQQLIDYADQVRLGRIKDSETKRTIRLSEEAPIYCYLIADIDETLKKTLLGRNLYRTPGTYDCYHGANTQMQLYFEVLSFDSVYDNAKKRNKAFFKQLGLE